MLATKALGIPYKETTREVREGLITANRSINLFLGIANNILVIIRLVVNTTYFYIIS